MAKIYVASSWRNHYSDVVDRLREGSQYEGDPATGQCVQLPVQVLVGGGAACISYHHSSKK